MWPLPRAESVSEAFAWCKRLATGHYENFPVGSLLLPASIRPHVFNVYAFSRVADDIADEPWTSNASERLKRLDALDDLVLQASQGRTSSGNVLLVALSQSILDCSLSAEHLRALLSAFRQDVQFRRPQTWDEVLDYCTRSANPVGRLILEISGVRNPKANQASDAVCTALQLINFWQDVSKDLPAGRNYLPVLEAATELATLRQGLALARGMLHEGRSVGAYVGGRLGLELRFIVACGMRMLRKCERLDQQLFTHRPVLQRSDYLWALLAAYTLPWRPQS